MYVCITGSTRFYLFAVIWDIFAIMVYLSVFHYEHGFHSASPGLQLAARHYIHWLDVALQWMLLAVDFLSALQAFSLTRRAAHIPICL